MIWSGLAQILGHESLEYDGPVHETNGRAVGRCDGAAYLLMSGGCGLFYSNTIAVIQSPPIGTIIMPGKLSDYF